MLECGEYGHIVKKNVGNKKTRLLKSNSKTNTNFKISLTKKIH